MKTHCLKGHALTPENTSTVHRSNGKVEHKCKLCMRIAYHIKKGKKRNYGFRSYD